MKSEKNLIYLKRTNNFCYNSVMHHEGYKVGPTILGIVQLKAPLSKLFKDFNVIVHEKIKKQKNLVNAIVRKKILV